MTAKNNVDQYFHKYFAEWLNGWQFTNWADSYMTKRRPDPGFHVILGCSIPFSIHSM